MWEQHLCHLCVPGVVGRIAEAGLFWGVLGAPHMWVSTLVAMWGWWGPECSGPGLPRGMAIDGVGTGQSSFGGMVGTGMGMTMGELWGGCLEVVWTKA